MSNPYAALPSHHFWRRSVSRIEAHRLDPVVRPKFQIGAGERVATAGSCFAQHISRKLQSIGFTYFVAEDAPELDGSERTRRGYGMFSARFGNIYTTRQLRQLYEEAFGLRPVRVLSMVRADGRLVDALRPQIEPDGFGTEEEARASRERMLTSVRMMFDEAGVLIFTLGLTEAWQARDDGTAFPIAPGVVAGDFDPERHEFINLGVDEVVDDLAAVLTSAKARNPALKVLLTVSPVPLVATYEDRHVLVSTTYSKAVLRVAADQIAARYDWVDYFPSYEIITGSYAGGLYYEADYRNVNHLGVAHAMRCFVANYAEGAPTRRASDEHAVPTAPAMSSGVICDEEVLDAVRF